MHPTDLRYSKVCLSGSRAVVRLAMAVLLAVLAGCGSAPVQEMSEARQAIEAARVAGAPQHAPTSYARARALLKSAEDMLNQHHFRKARENAAMARDEAIEAREAAQRISPE
jgi:Domain of unknown function (DUF4398)